MSKPSESGPPGSPKPEKASTGCERKSRSGSVPDNLRGDHDGSRPTNLVVDELLAYVTFHYMQCTADNIRRAVLNFYHPDAINDAKRALWEHCHMYLPPFEARRI